MLIIGVGNAWCGDDAAGVEVARRLSTGAPADARVLRHEGGDLSTLLEEWRDADATIVVDAARSGAPAGDVHRFDAAREPLPSQLLRTSTHAFGVAEAIELARALGRLPRALEVYAIEGGVFDAGAPLSPAVERAVERLVAELREG
jgi:hydrogenase maturation protease